MLKKFGSQFEEASIDQRWDNLTISKANFNGLKHIRDISLYEFIMY